MLTTGFIVYQLSTMYLILCSELDVVHTAFRAMEDRRLATGVPPPLEFPSKGGQARTGGLGGNLPAGQVGQTGGNIFFGGAFRKAKYEIRRRKFVQRSEPVPKNRS